MTASRAATERTQADFPVGTRVRATRGALPAHADRVGIVTAHAGPHALTAYCWVLWDGLKRAQAWAPRWLERVE